MRRVLILAVVFAMLTVGNASTAQADRIKLARELAEFAIKKFSGAAAREGVEMLAKRIASTAARHGDDVFHAVRRVGPKALTLGDDAAEHAPKVFRFLTRHGDDAAAILARKQGMKLFTRFGDEAGDILVRHPGAAEPLLENFGSPALKALGSITARNGRRAAMLAESEIGRLGKTAEILAVIAKFGDKGCDFIWSNRGALAVGTTLAAFLANPEAFINGGASLAKAAVEGGAKVSESIPRNTVAPVARSFTEQVARNVPWVTLGVLSTLGFLALFLLRVRGSGPSAEQGRLGWSFRRHTQARLALPMAV